MAEHGTGKRKGFTIVELLVAAGIFLTISTVAIGIFISALKEQRTLIHLMSVDNNASSAFEQITREIRSGFRFCDRSYVPPLGACDLTDTSITFVNYERVTTTYARSVDPATGRGALVRTTSPQGTVPLTGPDIDVSGLHFIIRQGDGSYCDPWRVSVYLEVRSPNQNLTSRAIRLQGTVSARTFPVEAPDAPQLVVSNCQYY